MSAEDPDPASLRIDKWLWRARLAKSRPVAQALCRRAVVRVNRVRVSRAHHRLRVGDVVTLPLANEVRVVRVLALGWRRGPASEARALYEELPPAGAVDAKAPLDSCPVGAPVL